MRAVGPAVRRSILRVAWSALVMIAVALLLSAAGRGRAWAVEPLSLRVQPGSMESASGQQAAAMPNPVIAFQGRLVDPTSGLAKPDGAYSMVFRIFDAATDGNRLWEEAQPVVNVQRSVFSVLLGDISPLTAAVFNGQGLWLGITVGSDPEMTPRIRIAHTAYALLAERVKDGAVTGATIADGSIGPADIANGAVDGARIADGTVALNDLAANSVDSARIVNGSVQAEDLAASAQFKFIGLDVFAAYLTGNATFRSGFGPNAGIVMPEAAGTASFYLNFVLPPNYTGGTPLTGRIVWHTPSINCFMFFAPNAISVARPGQTHIVGAGASTGINVNTNTPKSGTVANESQAHFFTITSPTAVALRPGDVISFSFYRSSAAANDTCTGEFVIQGVSLTYQ